VERPRRTGATDVSWLSVLEVGAETIEIEIISEANEEEFR
jgi:hypothetical protein